MIRKEHIKQSHEIKHDGTECFQCGKILGKIWRLDLGLFEALKFKKLYHLESGESMPCFCSFACRSEWSNSNLHGASSSSREMSAIEVIGRAIIFLIGMVGFFILAYEFFVFMGFANNALSILQSLR